MIIHAHIIGNTCLSLLAMFDYEGQVLFETLLPSEIHGVSGHLQGPQENRGL